MPKAIFITGGTSALYDRTEWQNIDFVDFSTSDRTIFSNELEASDVGSALYNAVKNRVINTLQPNLNLYKNETNQDSRRRLLKNLSAELASMLKFEESYGEITEQDKIYLLHSDTVDGQLCAEVNAELMREILKWNVTEIRINSLRVNDIATFQIGLNNLKNTVLQVLPARGSKNYMNITAGYTGLVPYATVLAWDYGMDLLYFFEDSSEILLIICPDNWPVNRVFDRITN